MKQAISTYVSPLGNSAHAGSVDSRPDREQRPRSPLGILAKVKSFFFGEGIGATEVSQLMESVMRETEEGYRIDYCDDLLVLADRAQRRHSLLEVSEIRAEIAVASSIDGFRSLVHEVLGVTPELARLRMRYSRYLKQLAPYAVKGAKVAE